MWRKIGWIIHVHTRFILLHNVQFSFYSNLHLCMFFFSYDNNIVLNVTINLNYT